jgi:hypothetical protein
MFCYQSALLIFFSFLFLTSIATDRLITSKDHASVQIAVADVDGDGKLTGGTTTFALSGPVRAMGESDDALNRLATKEGREFFRSSAATSTD